MFNLFDIPDGEEMPTVVRPTETEQAEKAALFPRRTEEPLIVDGWWKSWGPSMAGSEAPPAPLPTLNHNEKDLHVYTPARFLLADGCTVERYPLSGSLGIRVKGEPELVSLYSAFQRNLVREVTE